MEVNPLTGEVCFVDADGNTYGRPPGGLGGGFGGGYGGGVPVAAVASATAGRHSSDIVGAQVFKPLCPFRTLCRRNVVCNHHLASMICHG